MTDARPSQPSPPDTVTPTALAPCNSGAHPPCNTLAGRRAGVVALAGLALSALAGLSGCAEAPLADSVTTIGPNPVLVAPHSPLIPTVRIAPAVGWPAGTMPQPAPGLAVQAFASGLDHPRWLYVLPNGDVLVAETNAPPRPDEASSLRGWVMGLVMGRAGATVPSANRITLLRDSNGDGVADVRSVFLQGLNSPFGMALVGQTLYVANTDGVLAFGYTPGALQASGPGTLLSPLPAGPRNHHWTKNLIASADGKTLYATVGSNSNVGENGIALEVGRAVIVQINRQTGAMQPFATGLRNPNGMAWEPYTGALWTVVNERDELGDDLVPDYLTSVSPGGFYGWPYSYFGQHVDRRVQPQKPDLVAHALVPDYALGAHVAALGLAFARGSGMPAPFLAGGAFIGEHGSWNRSPRSGYKVVYLPFANGRPAGQPLDVLTGFVNGDGQAQGRPVGVAVAQDGALLVADDVGNTIWRVRNATR